MKRAAFGHESGVGYEWCIGWGVNGFDVVVDKLVDGMQRCISKA